jgi:hypothetical protein
VPRLAPTLLLTVSLVAGSPCGQWSLASRLATPSLYLALDTEFAARLRQVLPGSALARVLVDAGCNVPVHELELLSRVTELCRGTMEVALGGDDGAVVMHCELPAAAIARVQALIDNDALVERVSEAGGVPIAALRGARTAPAAATARTPAFSLYLGLAQGHLVVASALDPVRRLLQGEQAAHTLASDADFTDFSKRVEQERPALVVFGSWQELSASIARLLAPEHVGTWVVHASQVQARSLLLAVRPHGTGLSSSVLLRPTDAPALERWVQCVERVPLATLLADLPRAGLGSLTLAFHVDELVKSTAGSRVASLYSAIAGGCADVGLSVEQQVLQRLKGVAGVQMVAMPKRVSSAYVAKARSERDAQRLVGDARRLVVDRGRGRVEQHQAGEELVLPHSAWLGAAPRLAAVRDSVLVATEQGVTEQVALTDRAVADGKPPRWIGHALRSLPGATQKPVAGIVTLDLSGVLPSEERARAPLRQHAGYLRIHSDHIRLELFSQL